MMTRRAPYSMQAEWLAEPRSLQRFGRVEGSSVWLRDGPIEQKLADSIGGVVDLSTQPTTSILSIHVCSVGTRT